MTRCLLTYWRGDFDIQGIVAGVVFIADFAVPDVPNSPSVYKDRAGVAESGRVEVMEGQGAIKVAGADDDVVAVLV